MMRERRPEEALPRLPMTKKRDLCLRAKKTMASEKRISAKNQNTALLLRPQKQNKRVVLHERDRVNRPHFKTIAT